MYDNNSTATHAEKANTDEYYMQHLTELRDWRAKIIREVEEDHPDNDHAKRLAHLYTYSYILVNILEMNRTDLAINETVRLAEVDGLLKIEYYMFLGFLYLGNKRFEDAVSAFSESLKSTKIGDFSDYCIPLAKFGLVFAYIGLADCTNAQNEYINLKILQDDFNNEDKHWLDGLDYYFSMPKGLYVLKVSNDPIGGDYATVEEGKSIWFRIPFNYRFILDDDFAKKHNIDIKYYPKEIFDGMTGMPVQRYNFLNSLPKFGPCACPGSLSKPIECVARTESENEV